MWYRRLRYLFFLGPGLLHYLDDIFMTWNSILVQMGEISQLIFSKSVLYFLVVSLKINGRFYVTDFQGVILGDSQS